MHEQYVVSRSKELVKTENCVKLIKYLVLMGFSYKQVLPYSFLGRIQTYGPSL
jgi:hypothetical protein